MTTELWLTGWNSAAHMVGIVGLGLMALSLFYSLRKRKLVVRFWKMNRWLTVHHWAGFVGGVMVLVHTLGNLNGLGLLMVLLLLVVLGSSSLFFLERRSRRPLSEATGRLAEERKARTELDRSYRDLHARGFSASPAGKDLYDRLMAQHQRVLLVEKEVEDLKGRGVSFTWWRMVHNYATLMLLGVVVVHIWSKLYFAGVGL